MINEIPRQERENTPTHYRDVRVGQIVSERVHMKGYPNGMVKVGVVIYVHPEKRFYRVKFPGLLAPVVEAYLMPVASLYEKYR